jgi:hypothetical protein
MRHSRLILLIHSRASYVSATFPIDILTQAASSQMMFAE